MSKHQTQFHAAKLLEQLADKGFAIDKTLTEFMIGQQQKKELPLYLHALVGVGAFLASLFFIGFLGVAGLIGFRHETELMIWGSLFVAGAIGLQRIAHHDPSHDPIHDRTHDPRLQHSFLIQTSFTSMLMGKSLFVLGAWQMLDSAWGATVALFVLTVITYPTYQVSIDRFLSSFATLFYILISILVERDTYISRELLVNGFFLLQFAVTSFLLTHGKIKQDYIPLSYAFAYSLCVSVLYFATLDVELGYWQHSQTVGLIFINTVLTVGLISLFAWTAGGIKKIKTEPLLLASVGAVLLGLMSAPGVLLTIGFMVLGYAKHEKPLIITGVLLLSVFLWLYYYNLDISLLQKSGILIGSGIVLLAGRFYLKHKGWDKGGVPCEQK